MSNSKTDNTGSDSGRILLNSKSPFSMQEAYKTLRTNVIFSLPGSGCKSIGIASANRGEGKSTVAANLAISLAQINKKVVLVDCDMRLPTIASKFGCSSTPGLSNYLSGVCGEPPVISIEYKGIDIIPSGNIPPDSTKLISSMEMVKLVEMLKEKYDFIVFDFPPINIVSDAAMMSGIINGYLLVVRHNQSEYQMVAETVRQMRFANANIIGFVYNGKNDEKKYYKKGKYYKGNYYYYKKSSK